jgi:uncharacterized protein YbjT (DUF2867 family)
MILITGATGTNGIEIVRLLARSGVPCRALVRNAQKAAALAALPKVEIVEGDLADPETLAPAVEGVDKALLCSSIGRNLVELQGKLIRTAKRAGVGHTVKFSGMDADHSEWRFLRWHGQAEKEPEGSGLAFTHLQPNQFMQVYLRFHPTIGIRWQVLRCQQRFGNQPGRHPRHRGGSGPHSIGPRKQEIRDHRAEALTYSAVAEKLSEAIGKKVSYVDVPLATAKTTLLDGGAPEWFAEGQAEQFKFRWQGQTIACDSDDRSGGQTSHIRRSREHAGYFRGEETAVPTAMPSAH